MIKPFGDLLIRFRKDERGVFLVFFALIAVVLIAASGAVVDFTRVQQARTRAQIALDAAALALQAKISTKTATQLKDDAQALLTERIADSSVTAVVESATPDTAAGKLTISGYIVVPTYFVQLVGVKNVRSNMLSEVTRSSSDIEVSVSLDVTGSMKKVTCSWWDWNCTPSDKIGDLITATNTLIDLIVQPPASQSPTYSKMAIVPWSSAVNVGTTYAANVRGTPNNTGISISAITWYEGTSRSLSNITRANEAVFSTSNANGLNNGDWVYVSGVSGMTQMNGKIGYISDLITSSSTKTFKLVVNGAKICTNQNNSSCGSWSSYSSGGTVQKCLLADCLERVTTSAAHGIPDGKGVVITGTAGTSGINDNGFFTNLLSTTMYSLQGSGPGNGIRTSGGTQYCAFYGCQRYFFRAQDGSNKLWTVNNCATDRTTNPYLDTSPATYKLSMNYRDSSGGDCITQTIQPLTSDRPTLHTLANSLTADGSTAGHVGLAWGWYMISPNFASLWPTSSKPKAYGAANLIKAVVFMTDGVFNTPFCTGVVANDALSGAGGNSDHINCASPNGSSKSQAQTICTNIKATANKTLLYVVGFDLAGDTDTLNFLKTCATSDDYFFQADTGTDLQDAFKAIAQSLSELRISK